MYLRLLHAKNDRARRPRGFTVVEILIVIIVIAILATLTVVSYNLIVTQTKETSLKAELTKAAAELGITRVRAGSYPATADAIARSADTTFSYTTNTTAFCLQATRPDLPGRPFYVVEGGVIQEGVCPVLTAGTMQAFTPARCSALTTFTGNNNTAVILLTDSRSGTTSTYEVAKLADGKCWMLNNLKLGSTTSTTTLTSSDSNVAANFTLPQLTTTGAEVQDLPRAYGPVPGDTGAGATNYGYLYNWPAATAGATRTTNPANSGNAMYSICPANWRLPTGNTTSEFAMLDAKMNNAAATTPSTSYGTRYHQNWQSTGPFKGAFSGYRYGTFGTQGSYGRFWSSSAHPSAADSAFLAEFSSGHVYPGFASNLRNFGYAVRCLLN